MIKFHFMSVWKLAFLMLVTLMGTPTVAYAQTAPFLSTPYYGSESTNQGFSGAHPAYDFNMKYERVLAAASGTIETVGWFNTAPQCLNGSGDQACGYGLYIVIQHLASNSYRTRYGHLSSTAFDFTDIGEGAAGIIGTSGNTGWSTAAHLHFEVRNQNGIAVDPFAPNLWLDGQHANPSRPLPAPSTNGEIIVDDNSSNTSSFIKGRGDPFNVTCPSVGSCPDWYYVTGSNTGYSSDMHYTPTKANSSNDYWAKWVPSGIPAGGGIYEIRIYSPSNTYATSWQSPFTIVHAYGETTGRIVQGSLPNSSYSDSQWVSIGAYYLQPGDYVYVTSNSGEASNAKQIGVDAVKFIRLGSMYLPDIQQGNSWASDIVTTSNSGLALVSVAQYSTTGAWITTQTFFLPQWGSHGTIPFANSGAAIIDSTQQIAGATLRSHSSSTSNAAYIGVDKPATDILIPLVHRNNGGWNNLIYIQNSAASSATATVAFKAGLFGTDYTPSNYTIPALGTLVIDTASLSGIGTSFVGSARITTSKPVVVAYNQYTASFASMVESPALALSSNTLYAPLIQNNGGYISAFTLQNGDSSSQTLSATYYNSSGSPLCAQNYTGIGAYRIIVQNPAPQAGCTSTIVLSAKLATSGSKLSGQVNQIISGTPQSSGYPAISEPTKFVLVPRIYKNVNGWSTGLQVQNTGNSSTTVTIKYYDVAGALISTQTQTISSQASATFYPIPPSGTSFTGAATLTASQNLAVVVNHVKSGSGDMLMSHIGINR